MLSTASLLARRTGLVRGVATAVAPKLDWAHLQSLVHSDEAKREVGKLKKLFEDTREALAVQSKVRKEQGPGERGRTLWEGTATPVSPASRHLLGGACRSTGGLHTDACAHDGLAVRARGRAPPRGMQSLSRSETPPYRAGRLTLPPSP
jgi:hypothetical protein